MDAAFWIPSKSLMKHFKSPSTAFPFILSCRSLLSICVHVYYSKASDGAARRPSLHQPRSCGRAAAPPQPPGAWRSPLDPSATHSSSSSSSAPSTHICAHDEHSHKAQPPMHALARYKRSAVKTAAGPGARHAAIRGRRSPAGLAGSRGVAEPRPATRAPGRN